MSESSDIPLALVFLTSIIMILIYSLSAPYFESKKVIHLKLQQIDPFYS